MEAARAQMMTTMLGAQAARELPQARPATDMAAVWAGQDLDLGLDPSWAMHVLQMAMPDRFVRLPLPNPKREQAPGTLRLVCISDTHNRAADMVISLWYGYQGYIESPPTPLPLPQTLARAHSPGSLAFGLACPIAQRGAVREVEDFNRFLASQPHKHKVVIAGNHEFSFEARAQYDDERPRPEAMRALLTNCTYLEEEAITIAGLKFFGSPYQPCYAHMAFNLKRGEPCREHWRRIPSDTDILITHGPPIGFQDHCVSGNHAGCVDLLRDVQTRIKPMVHLFGHIHEDFGMSTDRITLYANAASCGKQYLIAHPPIVLDIPLPPSEIHRRRLAEDTTELL